MRQVFSSTRLENVEGVAQLLRDDGIEVRVTHGRSYKGGLRGDFSYREGEHTGPKPSVWVVKSEDQPRAREILRGAGLLDSTRKPSDGLAPHDSYLTPTFRDEVPVVARTTVQRRAFRIKLGLLLVIGVILALTLLRAF